MDITIKFKQDVDFKKVKSTVLKTIDSFDQCLKDPKPRVGIDSIETDGYTVMINAWINSHGYQDTRMELNERLMNDLKPLISKSTESNVSGKIPVSKN